MRISTILKDLCMREKGEVYLGSPPSASLWQCGGGNGKLNGAERFYSCSDVSKYQSY